MPKIARLYGKTDENGKTCNFAVSDPILMIYPSNESYDIEFLLGSKQIWISLFPGIMARQK